MDARSIVGITLLIAAISAGLLAACTPPMNNPPSDEIKTRVVWEEGPAPAGAMRVFTGTQISEVYDPYYEQLGQLVDFGEGQTGLTPTSFVFGIFTLALFDGEGHQLMIWYPEWDPETGMAWSEVHADFTSGVSATPDYYVERDEYVTFIAALEVFHILRSGGLDQESLYWMHPRVVVNIPGYDDAVWPDVVQGLVSGLGDIGVTTTDEGDLLYERRYIGAEGLPDTWEMTPGFLQPAIQFTAGGELIVIEPQPLPDMVPTLFVDYWDMSEQAEIGWNWTRIWPMCSFYMSTTVSEPLLFLRGHPEEPLDDPPPDWNPSGTGIWGSGAVMPLAAPLTISSEATTMVIHFGIDLEGIVEVYDHGTPEDKTDDVALLARNFWDRFHLSVTEE